MYIETLALSDYRNYRNATARLGPGLTILAGRNGQGKTNLLESIYLSGGRDPVRFGGIGQTIRAGQATARVDTRVRTTGAEPQVTLVIERGGRKLYVNGTRARAISRSPIAAAMFCPELLMLVKEGAEGRRQFLDDLLERLKPAYGRLRADYARAVRQRNKTLQNGGGLALDAWDDRVAELGVEVVAQRFWIVELLQPTLSDAHARLSGTRQPAASAQYRCSVAQEAPGDKAPVDEFVAQLRRRRPEELARGRTLVGPHRDDLVMCLDGCELRTLGSQGEQRTTALALTMCEAKLLQEATGEQPILLLDDAFSELDEQRRDLLLEIASAPEQAIATTAQMDGLPDAGAKARVIEVVDGKLVQGG